MKCESCNLTVAPHDREQIRVGKKVFHGNCFKRHIQRTHGGKLTIEEGGPMIDEGVILKSESP